MATGGEESPIQGVAVIQGFSNDSATEPEDGSPPLTGEGTKYLRLLDDDAYPTLWVEFLRDIRTACRKQQALRPEAEDHSQEIVSLVIERLPRIKEQGKNPWFWALKVIDLKSRDAIRKATKARLSESLTPTGDREHLGEEEGEVLSHLQGPPVGGSTAATFYGPEQKSVEEDEEGFARTFEECAGPAMMKLPAKKAQLLEDYYSLQNHDRENRERLAKNYGLESYNSLQVMIYRISGDLIDNMKECMQATSFSLSRLLKTRKGRGEIKRYIKKMFRP